MGFLFANFQLAMPFLLGLRSGTGHTGRQTDGQTDDGHQRIMPLPYGDGAK